MGGLPERQGKRRNESSQKVRTKKAEKGREHDTCVLSYTTSQTGREKKSVPIYAGGVAFDDATHADLEVKVLRDQ
jgi:hypothetical protein